MNNRRNKLDRIKKIKKQIYANTKELDELFKKFNELHEDIFEEYDIIDNTKCKDLSTREKLKDCLEIKHNLGQSLFKDKDFMTKDNCISLISSINDILNTNKIYSIHNIYDNNLRGNKDMIYYLGLYTFYIKNIKHMFVNYIYKFVAYNTFIRILDEYISIFSYDSHRILFCSTLEFWSMRGEKSENINECKYSENIMKYAEIDYDEFIKLYSKEEKYECMKEIGKLLISFLEEFKYNLEGETCLLESSTTKSASKNQDTLIE